MERQKNTETVFPSFFHLIDEETHEDALERNLKSAGKTNTLSKMEMVLAFAFKYSNITSMLAAANFSTPHLLVFILIPEVVYYGKYGVKQSLFFS